MAGTEKTNEEGTARRRQSEYWIVGIGLTGALLLGRDADWLGSVNLHTVMEVAATMLATVIAAMALVRYYSKEDTIYLFVGVGFCGVALLDGYHALVTSLFFRPFMPSDLPHLIPWSWVASRQFLSVIIFLSWIAWRREERLGVAGRINDRIVYIGVGIFSLISFFVFAFMPLPRVYYPETYINRPEEFGPALFFGLALYGYLTKGRWRVDAFEHWLVLSLIIGFISQAVFMSNSAALFDYNFDAAHTLKKISYVFILTGLLISMYAIFKRTDEGEKRVNTILFGATIGMIFIEESGIIITVNPAAERLFGYKEKELIGKNIKILMPEPYHSEHDGYLSAYSRTNTSKIIGIGREVEGQRKDGSIMYMHLGVSELSMGVQRGYTGFILDLTDRKKVELELAKQAAELDRVNQELSQFNYVVSHDLKAPLRAIHNYADFIAEDLAGKLGDEQEQYLQGLRTAVQEGESLIDDMLELSQLGQRKLEDQQLDLGLFLRETVDAMGLPEDVSIDINGQWPVVVAPPSLLRQVFQNLVTNGVKFNVSENKIIRIRCRVIDDALCEIEITDNGLGIPERFHNRIFEVFQRLHTHEQFEGTGIGLAIVSKAIGYLEGSVRIESQEGQGSTFYVVFPKKKSGA